MKYSKKKAKMIAELLATGKHTVEDCCEMAGISKSIFYLWKKTNLEFLDTIQAAEDDRLEVLKERAISGLFKLVDIYEYEEVRTEYAPVDPKDPTSTPKVVSMTRTKKKIMPNKGAIDTTLFNLYKDKFANKSQIDHTNKGESFSFGNFLMQAGDDEIPEAKQAETEPEY